MKGALPGSETGGGALEGEAAETAKSTEAVARIHVLTLSAEWGFHPAWMRESVEVFRVLWNNLLGNGQMPSLELREESMRLKYITCLPLSPVPNSPHSSSSQTPGRPRCAPRR